MKRRLVAILACAMILVLSLPVFAGGSQEAADPNKLVVWQFRGCNLENQIKQYGIDNGIEIDLQVVERDQMMNNLTTVLASGSGIPDVVTIGGPFIEKFKENPQHFVNLYDYDSFDGVYLDWRIAQIETADGECLIGLPTDIGPIALAYRRDVFEAAGLPADRDELGQIIKSYEDLIEVGKVIKEKAGVPLVCNIENVFQSILGQDQHNYWDDEGNLILDKSESVRKAWDFCIELYENGLSANIESNSSEWGAGLNNGSFAVQLLPSWQAGAIKGNAPDAAGLWDLMFISGTSNWGGSMISVPAKAANKDKAVEFITWLMSPEQQLQTFKTGGQFPTTVANYSNPELLGYVDPYFNDAPFGEIYSQIAQNIQGAYMGPDYETVTAAFVRGLQRVDMGTETPEASFQSVISEVERQLSR